MDSFWNTNYDAEYHNHRATFAEVIIHNDDGGMNLTFLKKFGLLWKLSVSEPTYGIDVPNGEYYLSTEYGEKHFILYKTFDGYIYRFYNNECMWKKADEDIQDYASLTHTAGYKKVTKKEANQYIGTICTKIRED